MLYKRFNDTYMLRIDKGEEVIRSLTELCEKENIRLAQVDAIGAAESASIGVYVVASILLSSSKISSAACSSKPICEVCTDAF